MTRSALPRDPIENVIPVTPEDLRALVSQGEDSRLQFKSDVCNPDSLAAEMAAFANTNGGRIVLGVADDGSLSGLAPDDVRRLNQLIGNVASQHVRSPLTVQTMNVPVAPGRVAIVLTIPDGLDKPYFDRNGVIWLKTGADKRRVQSKEELRRLFQMTSQFHADELPTRAGLPAMDRLRLRDFLRDRHGATWPDDSDSQRQLLQNLNLATDAGIPNLAGVLLFAEQPQRWLPTFLVKAVHYPGSAIDDQTYLDSEDIGGTLGDQCEGAISFVLRSLPKIQAGRGINSQGQVPIPRVVFEELIANALVHRDYLIEAPVRIFVFADRIEIISPGCLPNHLTVPKILAGNTIIRNPILVSFAAQGLLPYRGLGTGIRRALKDWPAITFSNDPDGNLFTVTVSRQRGTEATDHCISTDTGSVSTDTGPVSTDTGPVSTDTAPLNTAVMALLTTDPTMTAKQLAGLTKASTRTIERVLTRLQAEGCLRRIGSRKGGQWKVLPPPEEPQT